MTIIKLNVIIVLLIEDILSVDKAGVEDDCRSKSVALVYEETIERFMKLSYTELKPYVLI